jgi:hypothetical protein
VKLEKSERGTIVPSVPYDRVSFDYELNARHAAIPISFRLHRTICADNTHKRHYVG